MQFEKVKVKVAQNTPKSKNIILASVVIVVVVVASIVALVEYNQLTASRISLFLSKYEIETVQGSNPQIQAVVTSYGKAEIVILSSFSNSRGIKCTFEHATGKSNFTSTLTYAVADSTPTGKYNVTITASSGGQVINRTSVLSVLSANVTVSGTVRVTNPYYNIFHFNYNLTGIQFTDVETGNVTSFSFASQPSATSGNGNYSVILLNNHTYHIRVNFRSGADEYDNVLISASAGETAISKNFPS